MDVRRSAVAALALVLFVAGASLCRSQDTHTKYAPSSTVPNQSKSKQSLLDFSLNQINSADRDYGWCLGQDRALFLSETIASRFFWSNVICLALMAGLFLIIVFQHKKDNRNRWKLAEIVAQYEHALFRAQEQFNTAHVRNNDLARFISGLEEPVSQPVARREIPASSVAENGRQASPSQKNVSLAVTTPADKTPKTAEIVRGKAKSPNAQIGLFNDGDVVMKINSQEQQITELRGQVGLLRGQLTESEQKLRAEKDKNRALKGA